jgi:hypothetical protein
MDRQVSIVHGMSCPEPSSNGTRTACEDKLKTNWTIFGDFAADDRGYENRLQASGRVADQWWSAQRGGGGEAEVPESAVEHAVRTGADHRRSGIPQKFAPRMPSW